MFGYERWSVLAALRFLLAAIVAADHLRYHAPMGWMSFIPKLGAFEAVLGFLLISGYSIGISYQQRPSGFLLRRMARLYPIYLAAVVLEFASNPQPFSIAFWGMLLLNILFLNQALTATSFVGPAWSLSLEFWLYSLTPVLSRVSARKLKWLIIGSFGCYVLYTCGRSVLNLPYHSGMGYGVNLLALSFMWLCGFWLAQQPQNSARVLRGAAWLFGAHWGLTAAIQFAYRFKNHAVAEFFSEDAMGFAGKALTLTVVWLVFQRLLTGAKAGERRSTLLRTLGDISYPLYLTNYPVYTLLTKAGVHRAEILLIGAVAAAYVLYLSVDLYSRRRDKQSTTPATVPRVPAARTGFTDPPALSR